MNLAAMVTTKKFQIIPRIMLNITKFTCLLVSFLIISMTNFAQESVIIVNGSAKIKTDPDQILASTHISLIEPTYESAISSLNKKTKEVANILKKEGFDASEIKTISFNVAPNYEYHENKSVQKGFRASQNLEVNFKYDVDRLTKVVKKLAAGTAESTLNISFYLSDDKRASKKNEVLILAMKDALETAKVLAGTQNKIVDGFKEIKYGMNEPSNMPYMRSSAMMDKQSEEFAGFQAQEIEIIENVQVIWRVK
jgi:uncharacterized protein YggE